MAKAAHAPQITGEQIGRIWEAHQLGPVWDIVCPERGSVNHGLIVNQRYVVRFDLRGRGGVNFKSEVLAYELLRDSQVPVPEAIAFDDSETLAPTPYLITSRLEGRPLIDDWPQLSETTRRELAIAAGRCLAAIHQQPFDHFGNLYDLEKGGFARWYDYVYDYYRRYAQKARQGDILDETLLARIEAVIAAHESLFDQTAQGMLVHSDYHFENILQHEGRLSGVIDFEWAFSGDPACDFIVRDKWEQMCPGSRAPLVEGYTQVRALEPDHALRVSLYKLLYHLEDVAAWRDQPGTEDHAHGVRDLLAELTSLEEMGEMG